MRVLARATALVMKLVPADYLPTTTIHIEFQVLSERDVARSVRTFLDRLPSGFQQEALQREDAAARVLYLQHRAQPRWNSKGMNMSRNDQNFAWALPSEVWQLR
jgi:hypothetical protein